MLSLLRRFLTPAVVLVALGSAAAALAQPTPLTTAFTYQGELASAGTPATGTYDIRFRLFDAASGGNQFGNTLCSDNLSVSNGRFVAGLDFGAAAFGGQQRFLEIEVRADSGLGCGDGTGYTVLTPRQELTAAPNANFALIAAFAGTANTATVANEAITAFLASNATSFNGQSPSFYQNAANLTGTLADGQLSSNVARLNGNQTFTGLLNFTNTGNTFAGSGAGLTNLSGGSINAGTLGRSSLSADVQSGVGTLVPDLSLSGSVATGTNPISVAVSGSFAYVVNQTSNSLQVFNISNPAAPTLAGSVAIGSGPSSVAVSGSFAYVVNLGSNTLQVFNISNPAAPTLAGSAATGNLPNSVALSGPFAYVVNRNSNTLQVFNISNPAAPTLAGSVATGSSPWSVAVSGSFAYVANLGSNTLQVFNLNSPAAPTLAGSAATGLSPRSVVVSSSFAYVVNNLSNTLQVFNAVISVGFGTPLAASSLVGVNGSGLTGVNAASLNGQAASFYTDASNITSGTLADARLSTNIPRLNGNAVYSANLGIGVATPLQRLQVGGSALFGDTNIDNFAVGMDSQPNARLGFVKKFGFGPAIASAANQPIVFSQINQPDVFTNISGSTLTERMRIAANGNVGINNNLPIQTLDVNGKVRISEGVITDGANAIVTADLGLYSQRPGFLIRFVTSGGGFVWYTDGATTPAGGTPRMTLTSAGNLSVVGSLSKGGGSFKIDHPLDPENKYLYHSFVESPDMMNIYNGITTTDARGYAIVELPDYFEALNRDFRYQLTVVDDSENDFILAKVYRKIGVDTPRQFTIKSSIPNIEVSWQVTGIRRDAWAEKNRIPNSVDKVGDEKGKLLHPEAFGKTVEAGITSSGPATAPTAGVQPANAPE